MNLLELREIQAINTLVFETLGQPEKEREFKFKSLKRWGLDLIYGKKNNENTYFVSGYGTKKVGDVYKEGENTYEVMEILTDLPKDAKLYAHIEMFNGVAYLIGDLKLKDKTIRIIELPAGSVLLAYLKKHKLFKIIEALRSVGTASELIKTRGQEGKPYPYDKIPPKFRQFLKEAKKVEKEAEFGRLSLAYFGVNKDKDDRYRLSWLLPTISLFEINIAEKVNKLLEAID